ncbi:unnamed protein product, partial [Ceratitis capitata]
MAGHKEPNLPDRPCTYLHCFAYMYSDDFYAIWNAEEEDYDVDDDYIDDVDILSDEDL